MMRKTTSSKRPSHRSSADSCAPGLHNNKRAKESIALSLHQLHDDLRQFPTGACGKPNKYDTAAGFLIGIDELTKILIFREQMRPSLTVSAITAASAARGETSATAMTS
jgi:hypothetical protein